MNTETHAGKPADNATSTGVDTANKESASESAPGRKGGGFRVVFVVVLLAALVLAGLGVFWSIQPKSFDIRENAQANAGNADLVPGAMTVATAIGVAEAILDKPGGWLHNDMTPPGVLMDNMSSWEYGALTELRDSVRAMRNDFSRSQTQSLENEDLMLADSEFNFDSNAWFLPSAEEEYRKGVEALQSYLRDLLSGSSRSARFYARADNLSEYLAVVEKRLGGYGQRLTASVGDAELTAALNTAPGLQGGGAVSERTAWNEIDNIFFEARGYSWALLHMMKAIEVDFASVLADKNAQVSLRQIIKDLEQATVRKWSPMVLNGHGFGWLANHSLVLASYMARANAAVLDLRSLLERG
jgi:hypothetical protein